MESWVPNDVNCANFVTAVLQDAGLINWHDNTVAGTSSRLQAEGWTVVPASQAKPGDVCILNYGGRSEEHTSELQSLMRNSYAVFCLKKKKTKQRKIIHS